MGNRREEVALAQYMPASFEDACPHCGTPWVFNVFESKVQIVCHRCDRDQVVQGKRAHWWAVSGSYRSSRKESFEALWRAFVQCFGLSAAIAKAKDAPKSIG